MQVVESRSFSDYKSRLLLLIPGFDMIQHRGIEPGGPQANVTLRQVPLPR